MQRRFTIIAAPIQVNTNGSNLIVAGVAGQKIRVFGWSLSASGSVNAKWQSYNAGTTTDLTGLRYMTTGLVWDMPMATMRVAGRDAYLETLPGDGLQLNLSAGVAVGGFVLYEPALV